ncbi:MAG: Stk1 family PASTA domain-containing Ser/Thr kinase [Candidatus Eremiobacteraeota bacterium]|nr:Stk1 family PASTA domain-containing Ser/Thr kinase [Candidatus Eremiobacteraeota bacterium]MBV8365138.1 Stk1 family PASTA domain-containing Ser/Thr kinase [Candidatus Eremiobacteraeota bacterium]
MAEIIYNDRYRLDAKIGEGGMAVVHRGYDLILRRQVAVKVLRPAFSADAAFVQRFEFEAQAAAKLSHPNIVTTYDVGTVGADHYIVEEYVAGETLGTLIARQGRLPETAAVRYARQICAALAAAHRQDLLHRDIKPSNILITREDVVRVTDFGIAHAIEEGASQPKAAEALLGSLPYCPPEVLLGERVSEASDLYSLGVVMYEMVTGARPFSAADGDALAQAIVERPAPDPAHAAAGVSAHFAGIIGRLLRKAPADRYQSAGEVLGALRQLARSRPDEDEEEEESGPDAPTEILRRRARQAMVDATGAPSDLAMAPAPAVWRASRALAFAGALVGVLVLVSLILAARQAASRGTHVPDVTGKSVSDAVAMLHGLGIDQVAIKQVPDATVPGGLVSGTQPAAFQALPAGGALTLLVSSGPPVEDVPNVVGQEPSAAQQLLSAQGFEVKMGAKIHSSSVKQGMVAGTNPTAGSPLPKGSTVVVSVSLGPAMISVPNVVSLSQDDARKLLARYGLKLVVNSQIAVDNIPAGIVLSQDPSERSSLAPGATVAVDVSAGPASIEVPLLVGQTLDQARQTLSALGLSVGNVVQADVPDRPAGTIVSQTPGAFARVSQGAAIDVVVAAGGSSAAPPSPASSGAPAAAPSIPVPNIIGMSVDDAKGVLERNGYHLSRVIISSGTRADAKVLSADPAVGTTPASGNAVSVIIGQ